MIDSIFIAIGLFVTWGIAVDAAIHNPTKVYWRSILFGGGVISLYCVFGLFIRGASFKWMAFFLIVAFFLVGAALGALMGYYALKNREKIIEKREQALRDAVAAQEKDKDAD